MSNVKISELPEYSGNTTGSWLVMNNSGETITYKVKKENWVFPYDGDAIITGSLSHNVVNVPVVGTTASLDLSQGNLFNVNVTGSITDLWLQEINPRPCSFGFKVTFTAAGTHTLFEPDNWLVPVGSAEIITTSGSFMGQGTCINGSVMVIQEGKNGIL